MFKVAVMGAAGGIGQPLSMLMRCSPLVGELSLYDVAPVVKGVACDLSHTDVGAAKVCNPLSLGHRAFLAFKLFERRWLDFPGTKWAPIL